MLLPTGEVVLRDDRLLLASSIDQYCAILRLFKAAAEEDVDRGDERVLQARALLVEHKIKRIDPKAYEDNPFCSVQIEELSYGMSF